MKTILISVIAGFICLQVNSQVTRRTATKTSATKVTRKNTPNKTTPGKAAGQRSAQSNTPSVKTRQTITESRLNGPDGVNASTRPAKTTTKESPFVNGVHPAENADRSLDTVAANSNSVNLNSQDNVIIASANDTTFNANTKSQNGVNTTSGAVDRSGQSQFGQTNWGRDTRNTVGESQWTIPPPVTSTFNKEFPTANSATWSRNNADTSIYSARYRSGANWVTSSYNSSGERLGTRFEIPLVQAPRAVSVYLAKQPSTIRIASISRLQIQGKPEVYEIKTANGKTVYVNNDGMETAL